MAVRSETRVVPGDVDRELREDRLCTAFVALADSRIDDSGADGGPFGVLVARCVDLFGADGAGVLVVGEDHGGLSAGAASGEDAHALGVLQCQAGQGPGPDAHRSGHPVGVPDLAAALHRWPVLAAAARHAVYAAVHAVPLRAGGQGIGALCLYWTRPRTLPATELALAQTLADAATLGVLQRRETTRQGLLVEQLQHALASRVAIEQAKGVIAQRLGLDMEEAFETLRHHARGNNLRLPEAARRIVAGELTPDQLGRPRPAGHAGRKAPDGTAAAGRDRLTAVPAPLARRSGTPKPAPPATGPSTPAPTAAAAGEPAELSCRSQAWTTPEGVVLVLALNGTADPGALGLPVLAVALNTALTQCARTLVVDLAGLTAASSATFGLLAEAAGLAAANGTRYALSALPARLEEYLPALRGQVAVYSSTALAVAGLHPGAPVPATTTTDLRALGQEVAS